jgi:[acyl-carrier-protein] S-malonyltransferase
LTGLGDGPQLLAHSLGLAETARSLGLRPRFVAGHSLGEYAAAVVAGVLDVDDAMHLASERGRLMAAAQRQQSGAMGFVLGLPPDLVERACAQTRQRHGYVTVASINSPRQVVISGNASPMTEALALAGRWGARAGLLPIGGAFHSLLMASAQARLRRVAETMPWRDARIPLVSNADGRPLLSGVAIRAAVIGQMTRPVHWTACMETMLGAGCRHLIELGRGRVLTGFARRYSPELVAIAADSPAKLAAFSDGPAGAAPRNRLALRAAAGW